MERKFPKNPATSWVIRTLNEGKWLGKVLEGLFLQSRLDFEIIIVDSDSRDKTLEIVKQFPVRLVLNLLPKDFNYSYALNLGIKEAWGEFIGIISGHSLPVSRTWYEEAMLNFHDSKVAAVTGDYTSLPDSSYEEKLEDLFFDVKRLEKENYCKNMINNNAIVRKKLWKEYPFDEKLEDCEDYDWALEMLARGYKIVKDPKFNVYHSHGGIGRATYKERLSGWQKTCALLDKKPRPSKSYSKLDI